LYCDDGDVLSSVESVDLY